MEIYNKDYLNILKVHFLKKQRLKIGYFISDHLTKKLQYYYFWGESH